MEKLGQHFLTNKLALKKIAALLDLRNSGTVIEIGPGHGELTEEIRGKRQEARIIAIEKDERLADKLREKFSAGKNVEIISGDALKILPPLIENCKLKIENYKLIGNIPYYITGKLLRTIGELDRKPDICVLTVQREVAERLAAKPPRMNRLAASVQFWAEPEIALIIPKRDFRPAPKVDSAVVVLKPVARRRIAAEDYYRTVRAVFAQPRKTILNNISNGTEISKSEISKTLAKAGIDGGLRPQNLSVANILKLVSVFPKIWS